MKRRQAWKILRRYMVNGWAHWPMNTFVKAIRTARASVYEVQKGRSWSRKARRRGAAPLKGRLSDYCKL